MIYIALKDYGREGYGKPIAYFSTPVEAIRFIKNKEDYSANKYPYSLMDYDNGLFEFRKSPLSKSEGWIIMKLECGQDGNAVVC